MAAWDGANAVGPPVEDANCVVVAVVVAAIVVVIIVAIIVAVGTSRMGFGWKRGVQVWNASVNLKGPWLGLGKPKQGSREGSSMADGGGKRRVRWVNAEVPNSRYRDINSDSFLKAHCD
jgi:hypothetical protein